MLRLRFILIGLTAVNFATAVAADPFLYREDRRTVVSALCVCETTSGLTRVIEGTRPAIALKPERRPKQPSGFVTTRS